MPPKTKKQLKAEEKARLLEEQRIREEEEKKRQEEEEERRQEEERLRKLEEERLAKEERERLANEQPDLMNFRDKTRKLYSDSLKECHKYLEWTRYTTDDQEIVQKPDINKEQDITQFISSYKDNLEKSKYNVSDMLNQIQFGEEIVQEMENRSIHILADEEYYNLIRSNKFYNLNNYISGRQYQEYIRQIREIAGLILQKITGQMAIDSDVLIEEKQQELIQKQLENPNMKMGKEDSKNKLEITKMYPDNSLIKYGIWINPNSKGGFRIKPIDFYQLKVQCEVPRMYMSLQLIMNVVWTNYDCYSQNEKQKEYIIGGVLDIQFYEFLPMPKKTIDWQLKYNYNINEALKRNHYPPLDQNGQVNMQNVFLVKVQYTLSPDIYIHSEDIPKIAFFDGQNWSQENVEEVKLDIETKMINFQTIRIAPMAYIQDRTIDYPYKGFKIRSIVADGVNEKAQIDIQTKRLLIKFEIGIKQTEQFKNAAVTYIKLLKNNDFELEHIVNKEMSPSELLNKLYQCGINLLPRDNDFELAEINFKSREVEDKAIEEICLAARSFFIRSSKWSTTLPSDQIMVKIKENMKYDEEFAEDQEKEWKSIVFWSDKVGCVQSRDSKDKCNMKFVGDSVTHAFMQKLLSEHELVEEEAVNNLKKSTNLLFSHCIRDFLKLTRILAFTVDNK